MRFVRQLLRDRSAAVAVVALALQLFLLHGATAGFACASAEAAATSGLTVLCDGGASVSAHGRHSPAAPGRCCLDCLCGIACANGAGQLALAPSGDAGPAFRRPHETALHACRRHGRRTAGDAAAAAPAARTADLSA